ncbi:MAG: nucleotidyltransferase family protein [Pseudomonadota bacterium]|nr:nucleotidyltransferase family protein [Pseudomonadota bacterium]
MNPDRSFTVLVLAGRRKAGDPLADALNVSHKCLIPVAGETMLGRVLGTLDQSPAVGRVVVSIENSQVIGDEPTTHDDVTTVPSAATPCASVLAALDTLPDPWPVLVATADHPLLSPAMIDHFCGQARAAGADIAVALAPASTVLADYPGARRTFLPFRGERYTGCNLFAVMTPGAARAVEFWRRLEAHRKHPWRLFRAFGPAAAARFIVGGMTLDAAMTAASRRLDVTAAAIIMPFAEAAIDVDSPIDLALVEKILRQRQVTEG